MQNGFLPEPREWGQDNLVFFPYADERRQGMKGQGFICFSCCALVILLGASWCLAEIQPVPLLETDCGKCHQDVVKHVAERGALHTEVGCLECHVEHPPAGENAIPTCDDCHGSEDSVHYGLKECKTCHHPHYPLEMDFATMGGGKAVCLTCHPDQCKELEADPSEHTPLDCKECHVVHGNEGIPECGACHGADESVHYALKECSACHHAHYPLKMDFAQLSDARVVCLTCHPDQGSQMEAEPSEHAGLDCNECHLAHGEATECTGCHEPHSQEMVYNDCLSCHKPHAPVAVRYGDDLTSNMCSSCHEEEGAALAKSTKAHHELRCVECHESEHMATSGCEVCHDAKPHSSFMHEKTPNCLDCHRDPHALAE